MHNLKARHPTHNHGHPVLCPLCLPCRRPALPYSVKIFVHRTTGFLFLSQESPGRCLLPNLPRGYIGRESSVSCILHRRGPSLHPPLRLFGCCQQESSIHVVNIVRKGAAAHVCASACPNPSCCSTTSLNYPILPSSSCRANISMRTYFSSPNSYLLSLLFPPSLPCRR